MDALEEKTEERLQNLGTDEESSTPAAEPTPVPITKPTPEPIPVTEPAADSLEEIPENLRRSAIHEGWTDDQIKEVYRLDPEAANKTFERLHEQTNKLSAHWAKAGQVTLSQESEQIPTPQPTPASAQPTSEIDYAALDREYGEDDPLLKTVRALDAKLQAVTQTPVEPQQAPSTTTPAQAEYQEWLGLQMDSFFKDESVMVDKEFYGIGQDWRGENGISQNQDNNRQGMLRLADQIKTGASLQGENLTVRQAMDRAHMIVTEPLQKKVVRDEIANTLTKRENNMTITPNSGPAIPEQTGPLTEEQIEARAKIRLDKSFNST